MSRGDWERSSSAGVQLAARRGRALEVQRVEDVAVQARALQRHRDHVLAAVQQALPAHRLRRLQRLGLGRAREVLLDVGERVRRALEAHLLVRLGQLGDELDGDVGEGERREQHGAHEDRDQPPLRIVGRRDAGRRVGHVLPECTPAPVRSCATKRNRRLNDVARGAQGR